MMDHVPDYVTQIRNSLHLSMTCSEKTIREQATAHLKQQENNSLFYQALFQVVNTTEYGEIQNLQAAIYVTKFIQTEYVSAEGSFKFDLQEAMLQSFLRHPVVKVRNQLRVGITRLVITDFPKSRIFDLLIESLSQEKLMQMNDEHISTMCALYYFVFKALHTDKQNDHKLKLFVINYFNHKRELFISIIQASFSKFAAFLDPSFTINQFAIKQVQSAVSLSGLRYAIKFLNMENVMSIHTQAQLGECIVQLQALQQVTHLFCGLVDLHHSVEEQVELFSFIHELRLIISAYHKYLLGVVEEKRTTASKCIVVLEYLKSNYFLNGKNIILNNESFINSHLLADTSLLSKLQAQPLLVQFFEDEYNLIIQSLEFCSELIQVLGFKDPQHLADSENQHLNTTSSDEIIIKEYFDQSYFQIVLEFLLKKVLQLNWNQLALVNIEPERAFAEEKGEEGVGIRYSGVNLLRVLLQHVNEEKMMELLNELLMKYNSSVCTGKEPYSEILEREAFYFIMNGLYKDIKEVVEFDLWYQNVLATELIIDNDNLIPVKAQILNLILSYLENSYQIPQETAESLFASIASLMVDENQSLYIRLLSMKCFIPLMDSSSDLIINADQLMEGVTKLFKTCIENESKILLLDFIQNLIDIMKYADPKLMEPVYQFLQQEWQDAVDNEDSKILSIKAQITQVLTSIILKQGLDVKQLVFIAEVAVQGIQLEEYYEIYMLENGCRLLYFFTKDLNRKLSNDYPTSQLNQPKFREDDQFTPNEQALHERQILLQQSGFIEKILLNFVEKSSLVFVERQNLFHTSILLLIELINSPFESVANAVGNSLTKGITVNINEIKDELFCFIFDALEYLQIVYPISSAQVIEESVLALISESIKQAMFTDPMKLYVLRVVGRSFFNNISVGISLCEKVGASFGEQDFLHSLLNQTEEILQKIKPDSYFYRMQCSCILAMLQILLNNQQTITDKNKIKIIIDSYIFSLNKFLHILKANHHNQEHHWILANLQKLLSMESTIDPNEVNILKVNSVTKHLWQDKLKKIDFASYSRAFFAQNNLVPSIEIDFDKLSLE